MRGLLTILAFLFVAGTASAQDGTYVRNFLNGDYVAYDFLLCDGSSSPTKTCAEFDVNSSRGWPDHAAFEIYKETGCSATPEVTPRGFAVSGDTTKHDLVTSALTTAGTSAVVIDWPVYRYLDATIADGANCTDTEVILRLFYRR